MNWKDRVPRTHLIPSNHKEIIIALRAQKEKHGLSSLEMGFLKEIRKKQKLTTKQHNWFMSIYHRVKEEGYELPNIQRLA